MWQRVGGGEGKGPQGDREEKDKDSSQGTFGTFRNVKDSIDY